MRGTRLYFLSCIVAFLFILPNFITTIAEAKKPFSKKFLQQLGKSAKKSGISSELWQKTHIFLKEKGILEEVIELDRKQPETLESLHLYTTRRINNRRITLGKSLLKKHNELLQYLEIEYGIPSEILISIWGLESDYGNITGHFLVLHATASLNAEGRRGNFFHKQFIAGLRIADREDFHVQKMLGSWAGAMGHVQFIPTTYWQYARDGNGDGKIDIWSNVDDALTSAANYLEHSRWDPAHPWGLEVLLPESFNFDNIQTWHDSEFWRNKGIKNAHKSQHSRLAEIGESTLLLPAGASGPAFLVSQNFNSILRWNNSNLYAIAVGLLADRLLGVPDLLKKTTEQNLRAKDIKKLQQRLNELGFNAGVVDAVLGTQTRRAISRYQKLHDLVPDGFPSPKTLRSIGL